MAATVRRMSRVPRWAWLVALGTALVVGGGVYLGLYLTAAHNADMGLKLAALDRQTRPEQVQAYRDELASDAVGCGVAAPTLAGWVTAAKRQLPYATAWGLLTTTGGGYPCDKLMLEFMTGTRADPPSTLPTA